MPGVQKRSAAAAMLTERWGAALMGQGFVAVPIALLRLQRRLSLEPTDLAIVAHLLRFWIDGLPFPSMQLLAKDIGVHKRTISRRIRSMRAAGYLETVEDHAPKSGKPIVRFDLRPLIEIANREAIKAGLDGRHKVRT